MKIDLLMTADNRLGILSDAFFENDIAAAMFEADSGNVWLEYTDMAGTFEMNIPVAGEYVEPFHLAGQFDISLELGVFAEGMPRLQQHQSRSVLRFEHFMKSVISGQPLHRDDLGDEDSASGIAADVSPAALELAPQLQRQRQLEAAPKATPQAGPKAPGLGAGGNSGGMISPQTGGGGQQSATPHQTPRRPGTSRRGEGRGRR